MSAEDIVVGIVVLNGGELFGRTRLQKSAFLLEQSGMNSGLEFEYLHYGPYSAELARGWDEAAFDRHITMTERPGSREMPYTVFEARESAPSVLGSLSASRARKLLMEMGTVSDIVLEVAATIVYLRNSVRDPIEEVKILKPHKATPRRLAEAIDLIDRLGLTV